MPRTRIGTSFDEKSGAKTKSGAMRASTRTKPTSCCGPNSSSSSFTGRVSSGIDRVQLCGVDDHLVEHPRAGDDQHGGRGDDLRDEGERLLLDLRDGLEDRDDEADEQAGEQEREADLQRELHRVHREA